MNIIRTAFATAILLSVFAAAVPHHSTSPDSRYKLYHELATREVAVKKCAARGGRLAHIRDLADQLQVNALSELIRAGTSCAYIGGHVPNSTFTPTMTFMYSESNTMLSAKKYPETICMQPSGYCNWHTNEPNNVAGNEYAMCAHRPTGKWIDLAAAHKIEYICEFCPFQHLPLRTLRDGGDSLGGDNFKNFSITTEGTNVKITMQPEYGAGFVVGPPVEQLENSHGPYGQQLVTELWPGQNESSVVSKFRQPADNLHYDSNANCLLTMTASIERFCGPREDIPNLPTHYARQCNVTLCKLYAANDQKTQLRVAMCSAVEFELRYAKDNAHCDSQSSGLVGCAPSVHVFDWSTNKAGNTYEFRGMESVRNAIITKVECESTLMDCSTCFVTHGSTFRCLAKNTTSSGGSTQSERVTMKITANVDAAKNGCPNAPGSTTCSSVMTHTADLKQLVRALTVYNFQTFAASFGCAPGQVLPLSRSDRLSFEILAIETALLSVTKLMLVGKTQSFNILAKKTKYNLQSTVNKTLLFGDGSGAASAGVKVKVGESVKIDFSLATLSDVAIEESLKFVVEVERRPLVITNRRRLYEVLAAAPRRHEATLGEICLGDVCEPKFKEDSESDQGKNITVIALGAVCGCLVAVISIAAARRGWKKKSSASPPPTNNRGSPTPVPKPGHDQV